MNTIAVQDIKRRGLGVVDGLIAQGPVQVVKNNRPRYVVMSEADYQTMLGDLAAARLAASLADVKAGRVRRGTVAQLVRELRRGG